MNKLFATKIWQSLWASLLLVLLTATSASAGGWEFEGYFWSGSANVLDVGAVKQNAEGDGVYKSRIQEQYWSVRNSENSRSSRGLPNYTWINTRNSFRNSNTETTFQDGVATPSGLVASSVTARFKWRRNETGSYDDEGNYNSSPDPDDNPPSHVYIREQGSVSANTYIAHVDGWPYSAPDPWIDDQFEITGSGMDGLELGAHVRYSPSSWIYKTGYKTVIRRVAVSGDSLVVPSRSFDGEIKLLPKYKEVSFDRNVKAYLNFGYNAEALNFSLNVSAPAVSDRQQTKPNAEEIDALVGLRWLHPENIGTGEDEDPIKPSRSAAKRYWDGFILGDGQIDDGAPIPYFAGQATFSVTATGSDGRTPIFNGQTYKWTPEDNKDPFDPDDNGTPGPGFVATSDTQRTYVWNFGSAQEGDGNFPQTTDVTVEVSSADGDGETLEETKTINWHSTWSPTETGLQKNVVTSKFGRYVRPDGSPVAISDVKPGDTILCFVEGDPGFSTDGNRLEKIRPVPHEHQVPGPGERIEPRVVGQIVPSGDNNQIIIFNSKPQVRPDDDPDAAGFDEIQRIKEVAATSEHAYQTGKSLTTTALTIQLELMKAAAFGPAEGVALATAIKGVVAVGKFAEAAKGLRAGIKAAEKGAEEARLAAKGFEAMKAKGGLSAKRLKDVEQEIKYYKGLEARHQQSITDSKSLLTNGERYAQQALAKFKKEGCFVAGTLVWMGDGLTKPIEQVKVGDLALSKNEQTGEIAAKRVTNVSVRADIWTRKLTFEGGAVLETTDEHPVYVEGSGFVKAKEIGIGNSIVTRAGPSAKVVAVQADVRQATVYNFTVDAFHTYFVGPNAWWVHNADCSEFVRNLNTRPPASGANPSARQYQINQVGDVEYHIGGAGDEIWADGIRINANNNTITAMDAKFVGTPNSSPYIPDSGCPDFIRQSVRNDLDREFVRYKAAINDATNPISELEIITNDARAVTYFQSLMSNHNIVGRVLLRP